MKHFSSIISYVWSGIKNGFRSGWEPPNVLNFFVRSYKTQNTAILQKNDFSVLRFIVRKIHVCYKVYNCEITEILFMYINENFSLQFEMKMSDLNFNLPLLVCFFSSSDLFAKLYFTLCCFRTGMHNSDFMEGQKNVAEIFADQIG